MNFSHSFVSALLVGITSIASIACGSAQDSASDTVDSNGSAVSPRLAAEDQMVSDIAPARGISRLHDENNEVGDFTCTAFYPGQKRAYNGTGKTGPEACAAARRFCDRFQDRPDMCTSYNGLAVNYEVPGSYKTGGPRPTPVITRSGVKGAKVRCSGQATTSTNTYPKVTAEGVDKAEALKNLIEICNRDGLNCGAEATVWCNPIVQDPWENNH